MSKYPPVISICYVLGLMVFLNIACTPQKNTAYFQTIPFNSEVQTLITKDYEHKIKVDDILAIAIVGPGDEIKNFNASGDGYLVDKNGNIQLYKIGDIKVQGLTLTQVKQKIINSLVPDYFKQLSVSARFKSHRVVVLGEVGSPGVVPMETEHISLLEAVALKGDLSPDARKDNILVIRNTEKGKIFYRINLLDGSVFNSNFYYLQPDDIVYVEPDPEKSKVNYTPQIINYVLAVTTLVFLFIDRL